MLERRSRQAGGRPRLQDPQRPVHRPAVDPARHLRAPSRTTPSSGTCAPRRPRRRTAWCTCRASRARRRPRLIAGDIGGVPKLRARADRRHARRQGAGRSRPTGSRSRSRRCRSPSSPSAKGDEEKIGDALHRLIEEDPVAARRTRPADPRVPALRHRPAPRRDRARAHEAAFERRGHPAPAEGPLPGDHPQARGGPWPPQEAERRPRPVRRLPDQDRAACRAAAISSSWTRSSAARFRRTTARRSRRASRRPGTRGFLAGYPMVDFRVRLLDGQYHDVDSSELAFKIAGSLAYKDAMARRRRSDASRAGDEGRDPHQRGVHGRHHERPLAPPRPPAGHGRQERRPDRPGAWCRWPRCSTTPRRCAR